MVDRRSVFSQRDAIIRLAHHHGAHDVRLFGSLARGDATEASDVDLLVRFDPDRSLLDHGELLMDLRDLLGCKVDVVSEGALQGRFGRIIRREAIPL